MGFTLAFLPCGVSRKSIASYVQTEMHPPHDTQHEMLAVRLQDESVVLLAERRCKKHIAQLRLECGMQMDFWLLNGDELLP